MRAVVVGMLLLCGLLLCGLAVFSVNVIDLIDMELIEFCIKWCAELQAWVKNLYTGAQEIVRPSPPVAAALTVSLVLFVFMLLVLLLRAETWRPVNTVAQKNLDVPIIPRPAVPAAEDEHQDRMVGTRPVQTLRPARPHQLSIAGVETQWQKMRKSGVSGWGKGTRPDGSPWWQVRVRLPNGLVIEVDPYGTERYHWHTKDGKYHRSRNKPKDLG